MFVGSRDIDRDLGLTWPIADGVRGFAAFSACGNYRYYLSRRWAAGPIILWVCMNPSSATDELDDSTSRKLTRHSQENGAGSLILVNIMDYRATNPDELPHHRERSNKNLSVIERSAQKADRVILAYGGLRKNPHWINFAQESLRRLNGMELLCVARNNDRQNSPRHPRRFPETINLEEFEAPNAR